METQGKVSSEQMEKVRVKAERVFGSPKILLLASISPDNKWRLSPWVAQVSDEHGPLIMTEGKEASECLDALDREIDRQDQHQNGVQPSGVTVHNLYRLGDLIKFAFGF